MNLVEFVLALHGALAESKVPHAFGGALALAYYGQPRATRDVDLNVFVGSDGAAGVDELLRGLGLRRETASETVPVGGRRFVQDDGPVLDLFLDLDDTYRSIRARVTVHPFGRGRARLPFLSAEDLVTFKLSFGRPRDWVDIEDVVANGTPLDLDTVEATLLALRGPHMHPRLARLRAMVAAHGASPP
jgi:hypothetical protein